MEMVSVRMTDESCRGGHRLKAGADYRLPMQVAASLIKRGSARPSAEACFELLKGMGLCGVVVTHRHDRAMAEAARKIGISLTLNKK